MIEDPSGENYTKPWVRHAILWTGFAILLVVGIWTVVLPAVEDSPVDPTLGAESDSTENTSNSEE